ncbi:hypothetical protein B9Z19DRAFT_1154611 [Tuber borchii]|uniref:Uncharacterized protein n=1 Tax=Tuber borchii TaxID=42251 RepID=A0A2T6ZIA7_TUBBO|nr:hypothetical protein B9Z19DRAFT_1154611 [Tuber borchii]
MIIRGRRGAYKETNDGEAPPQTRLSRASCKIIQRQGMLASIDTHASLLRTSNIPFCGNRSSTGTIEIANPQPENESRYSTASTPQNLSKIPLPPARRNKVGPEVKHPNQSVRVQNRPSPWRFIANPRQTSNYSNAQQQANPVKKCDTCTLAPRGLP